MNFGLVWCEISVVPVLLGCLTCDLIFPLCRFPIFLDVGTVECHTICRIRLVEDTPKKRSSLDEIDARQTIPKRLMGAASTVSVITS